LRLLIESGVDIHQKFPGDNTVLHLHLANDRTSPNTEKIIEMTTMLIAAGADINARNADGKTPLCMAREGKYKPTEYVERMTSFMIENGAVE
jgi:ankyrin repeat protein